MAHERLGHAGIHAIHAHMVRIVGSPTERELGQVARADHEATELVGKVHKDLGAFAGLGVLVGDIRHARVVADVGEMRAHGLADRDGAEVDAQLLGQALGVGLGTARRAEAGHGHRMDARTRQAEHVEGAHRDKQGERGVEATRQADDGRTGTGMGKARLEAGGLQVENLLARRGALRGVRGHERHARRGAQHIEGGVEQQLRVLGGKDRGLIRSIRDGLAADRGALTGLREAEIDRLQTTHAPLAGTPRVGAAALGGEFFQVHIGHGHLAREQRRGRHDRAVLGDEVLTREDEVGGGLALARVRVGIGAVQARALTGHEATAVRRLAHDLTRRARVQNDRRAAGKRHVNRGRVGDPQVLADLDADAHVLEAGIGTGVDDTVHERHGVLAGERDESRPVHGRGREPALLVKLAVVGQMAFDGEAQQAPRAACGDAVVDVLTMRHGQAHGEQQRRVGRVLEQGGERGLASAQQGAVVEKVAAGITRKAELGQGQHARTGADGRVDALENGGGVAGHVTHADLGRGRGDAQIPVAHRDLVRCLTCGLDLVHASLLNCSSFTTPIVPAQADGSAADQRRI